MIHDQATAGTEPVEDQCDFQYSHGGVPGFLVIVYVGFLIFSLLYVVDYFAPAFLHDHPQEGPAPLQGHAEP